MTDCLTYREPEDIEHWIEDVQYPERAEMTLEEWYEVCDRPPDSMSYLHTGRRYSPEPQKGAA